MTHPMWKIQQAIVFFTVFFGFLLLFEPKDQGAASIFGLIVALIITGLLTRLIDLARFQRSRRRFDKLSYSPGSTDSRARISRHPRYGTKLIPGPRIGKYPRKFV